MSEKSLPGIAGGASLSMRGRSPGFRTRVLVVDRDPSSVAVIRSILRAQDWEIISAKTGAEALQKARVEGPDAVVAELSLADMSGADLCRNLRQRSETALTPIFLLGLGSGVSERVISLRAGATDYLVKPPNAQELVTRLKAALDLRRERAGFVIMVLGGKGGVGASVLAVNLAIALRHETRAAVVLVDAAVHGGTVDVMLNPQPTGGARALLPRLDELEAPDFEAILTRHSSGLQVFPLQEGDLESMQPEEMRKILVALRRIKEFIIIDTSAVLDANASAILDLADRVLMVVTPEITSVRGAKLMLARAEQAGLPRERLQVVLNRFPQRRGLQRRDIETALGAEIRTTISDDVNLVTYSINRGVPLAESHPRSGMARQIGALAKSLAKAAQKQHK